MFARNRHHIVTAGHVDHGKSTILGRLLADTQSLPDGKLQTIQQFCEKHSKPFEYAFVLDALRDEQNQGITIEAARVFMKRPERDYLFIDAPGHIEFLKNFMTAAGQVSSAMLVLDAAQGIEENSKRHLFLLNLLGVKNYVAVVSKMDIAKYEKRVFERICEEASAYAKSIGANVSRFIPVSAAAGENITQASGRMSWYSGPTLLGAIELLPDEEAAKDSDFRMPVQDIYRFSENGDDRRIVAGTIDSGQIKRGDELIFYPSGKTSRVASIETFPNGSLTSIAAPHAAGFTLTEQIYVKRGEVAVKKGASAPSIARNIRAKVFWLGRTPLERGKSYPVKIGTAAANAVVDSVIESTDTVALVTRSTPDGIKNNEVGECILRLDRPVVCDARSSVSLGRFVLLDDHFISGGGLVSEILPDDVSWVRQKVVLRNAKWQKGLVPLEARESRFGQTSGLVLVTGARDSKRKEIARELESALFAAGKLAYYLGLGSVLYGLSADIRGDSPDHEEDIRRLAETAHILLDAGMILIVSASELTDDDVGIISEAVDRERIETVWIGPAKGASLRPDLVITEDDTREALAQIRRRLTAKGFLKGNQNE